MERISASKAKWVLKSYLQSRIFWSRKIILWDSMYDLVDDDKLDLQPISLPVGSDCDDRAFVLFGEVLKQHPRWMFGVCEGYNKNGERHAWCYFISKHTHTIKHKGIRGYSKSVHIVKYVEPNTAEIFSPTSEQAYHFIR